MKFFIRHIFWPTAATLILSILIKMASSALIRYYLWDILLASYFYYFLRISTPRNRTVLTVLAGSFAAEVFQLLGIFPGTFDLYDFIAYFLGVIFSILIFETELKKLNVEFKSSIHVLNRDHM